MRHLHRSHADSRVAPNPPCSCRDFAAKVDGRADDQPPADSRGISASVKALGRPSALTTGAVALSNLVNNVPGAEAVRRRPSQSAQGLVVLAITAALAGNLSILRSIADLIVVERLRGAHITIG